jgi:hypothetical protein
LRHQAPYEGAPASVERRRLRGLRAGRSDPAGVAAAPGTGRSRGRAARARRGPLTDARVPARACGVARCASVSGFRSSPHVASARHRRAISSRLRR